MKLGRMSIFSASLFWGGLLFAPLPAMAEDIDIFNGPPGSASAPSVMIFLDNSVNDLFAAKIDAISAVLDTVTASNPLIVGLAMWSPNTTPKGAYIRFAPRDMGVAANKTALKNILARIKATNDYAQDIKMEPLAYYEIYKYYSGLAPYAGGPPAKNPNADKDLNSGNPVVNGANSLTAYGQGLRSGFAFRPNNTYDAPVSATCSRNYIVYIAANNNFQIQDISGQQTYEGLNAGPALPGTSSFSPTAWADEWTSYLFRHRNPQIVSYVIDAASAGNSDAQYTKLLQDEAKQGGGRWFFASTQQQITTSLLTIFDEIQSVNSAFASASLPINATNRTLSDNQVYIGMFRPDLNSKPRWFGNLKKYQLVDLGSGIELGDSNGAAAVNTLTGFLANCAVSYWTTDSGTYWITATYTPAPAGTCPPPNTNSPYSDAPDGPFVEKGAVAEVLRKGNTIATSPPVWATYRTQYTLVGSPLALAALTTANTGLDATTLDWVRGRDVDNENALSPTPAANAQLARFSIHGDIVHSHPYIVDASNLSLGITAYYGANDGALRAVDTATGRERWSFFAPEAITQTNMNRLRNNTPAITFFGQSISGSTPKNYFFDGALSAYQSGGVSPNSTVWLYASQRRGGRMIHSFDVSNPNSPTFKWRVGCTNPLLSDTASCSSGTTAMGQTWSTPTAAFVQGFGNTTQPVVIVGAGYDTCEDANTSTPSCATPKGNAVYVLNGNTGAILKTFATDRSVAADIALVDVNNDGYVDYAYAVDTGGNIYRIDFVSSPYTAASRIASAWTIRKVAKTTGSGRKFLFAPAVLPNVSTVGNFAKVFVALGSGDREQPLTTQYPYTTPVTNRFYVYVDDLTVTSGTEINLDTASTTQDLSATTSCATPGIVPNSTSTGWFIDLKGDPAVTGSSKVGEQTVGSAVIAGGMVAFNTNRPLPTPPSSCTANLGEARGYWLDLFNASGAIGVTGTCGGARSDDFVGGGLPPSPVLTNVTVNGQVVTVVIGAADKKGGVSAGIQAQKVTAPVSLTRRPVYWLKNGDN